MSCFVFRNNTIERFFPKDYTFSGYGDISYIPDGVDIFVWFYQLPIMFDACALAGVVEGYSMNFEYALGHIGKEQTLLAVTMDILYDIHFVDDCRIVDNAVSEYNANLFKAAENNANVKVLDIHDFTRKYGADELFDWKYYFISQMGLNPRLANDFKGWWEKKLCEVEFKRKKCLVLDLDNTLWGGILGEDGPDGIKVGGEYPGKAFQYFQEGLLELSKHGTILAVCSKNNESDVFEAWEHNPFLILRKEHFSSYRINWNDKADNIRSIAEELNLGLDSFVFVDDNPSERELVRQLLPMVETPEFPQRPYELPVFFQNIVNDYFRVYAATDEDRKKTEQYKANAARSKARGLFNDFSAYLKSLDIRISIKKADEFNIPRIAQMTQKTNQFNLTTRRYSDADIRGALKNGWRIWCIDVADRFGGNGITGCMILNGCEIDSFLLSCRILGKGIETVFMKIVLSMLKDCGYEVITAMYLPSSKNMMVRDFYEECGFECTGEMDGAKNYAINLNEADLEIKGYYQIQVD